MSEIPDFANFEDLLVQVLTPFQYIDTSDIKPLKKVVTQKDLERQGKQIVEVLIEKSKLATVPLIGGAESDWKKRLESILLVQQCFVSHHILRLNNIHQFALKISEPLSTQLFDLRATLTKEVCKTIALMA